MSSRSETVVMTEFAVAVVSVVSVVAAVSVVTEWAVSMVSVAAERTVSVVSVSVTHRTEVFTFEMASHIDVFINDTYIFYIYVCFVLDVSDSTSNDIMPLDAARLPFISAFTKL